MDINCSALSKVFADIYVYSVNTRPRRLITKSVLLLFHEVFLKKIYVDLVPTLVRNISQMSSDGGDEG